MGLRLNLGCGRDLRPGHLNVDIHVPKDLPPTCQFLQADLSQLPWPWADGSADSVMMLDFLEHFPYRYTGKVLAEAWRVLVPDGTLEVQVPDFTECARAVLQDQDGFLCNRCGHQFDSWLQASIEGACPKCSQKLSDLAEAAIHRLYGGQDVRGNWHHTAFTESVLHRHLESCGFDRIETVELNENGETHRQNWNIKLVARKGALSWEEP